ncbi:MAG: hypothetical protein V4727_06890 [Verrucomicrobiota bacterium]
MFTTQEQPLISGSPDEVEEFVDCDRCLIVDWKCSEEEVLDDVRQFLPPNSLHYENIEADSGSVTLRVRFMGREDFIILPAKPQNNFRVLLRLSELVQPDFDMKIFRCTDGSDTHGFLIRSKAWWEFYRTSYPKQYDEIFRDMSDLTKLWDLEGSSEAPRSESKPWWKFWG